MNSDAFADRLREAIGNQSIRSFASAAGMSDTVVRQYLSGKSDPSRSAVIAMARAADVNLIWLVSGEGEIHRGTKEDSQFYGQAWHKEVMLQVIEEIEQAIIETGRKTINPGKKAQLIVTAYEITIRGGGNVDRQTLKDLILMAA